jgi:hypothetical protein
MKITQGEFRTFDTLKETMTNTFIVAHVLEMALLHFCYGTYGHDYILEK